jgi:hypothetical protein
MGRKMTLLFKAGRIADFLIKNGFVYTFKQAHRGIGWDHAIRGGFTLQTPENTLGLVEIAKVQEFVARNSSRLRKYMTHYLPYSGFDSVEEWLATLKTFIEWKGFRASTREPARIALYRVALRAKAEKEKAEK